ncbi:MAG: glucose-6-phosphate dehydrogenase, partial [Ignavibacteria bacterium]|nr:glucose-6-phosphate dehydrogenase [Ignavibacteria bacterium]
MNKTENHIYVIFGASGDLTKRKLVPAIYSLFVQNMLPENFVLLGVSRTEFSDDEFRSNMESSIKEFNEIDDDTKIDEFIKKIFYTSITFDKTDTYKNLKEKIVELRTKNKISGNTIFYLSTPPSLYGTIPQHLAAVVLNKQDDGWKRLIIEKPFGYDLQSALKLKDELLKDWTEEQIFRIDHYLGKETVQN